MTLKTRFQEEFGRDWRGIEDFPYVVVRDTTEDKYSANFEELFSYFMWLRENGYDLNQPHKYFGLFLLRSAYSDNGKTKYGHLVFDETPTGYVVVSHCRRLIF